MYGRVAQSAQQGGRNEGHVPRDDENRPAGSYDGRMNSSEAAAVRPDIVRRRHARQPISRCGIVGDQKQVVCRIAKRVRDAIDDTAPADALESLRSSSISRRRTAGENQAGASRHGL